MGGYIIVALLAIFSYSCSGTQNVDEPNVIRAGHQAFSKLVIAQTYEIEKLKVVSIIWGETYLFHPSIIRSDKSVEWERQLIEFLPKIKNRQTNDEITAINDKTLELLKL